VYPEERKPILEMILSGRMLVALMMGFACGLPLLLTISVLQAWMKEEGVDLAVIGMMALVGIPYTLKFLWAPIVDRFTLPFLGRRSLVPPRISLWMPTGEKTFLMRNWGLPLHYISMGTGWGCFWPPGAA